MRARPVPGVAGLLLTGGSSRRMGRDKATLPIGGTPCAERVARCLSLVVEPALEVGPGRSGLAPVREPQPGQGPLVAVAAGWRALTAGGHRGPVVILACDLPFVTEGLLRLVAASPGSGSIVPVAEGRPQPLLARFGADALDHADGMVAAGHRSLAPLLEQGNVSWLCEERWGQVADNRAFFDLDTPDDLIRLGLVAE